MIFTVSNENPIDLPPQIINLIFKRNSDFHVPARESIQKYYFGNIFQVSFCIEAEMLRKEFRNMKFLESMKVYLSHSIFFDMHPSVAILSQINHSQRERVLRGVLKSKLLYFS